MSEKSQGDMKTQNKVSKTSVRGLEAVIDSPRAMSTPSTQILLSKYHSPFKGISTPWRRDPELIPELQLGNTR